jgi:hypothetical protein
MTFFGVFPGREIPWCCQVSVLVDMDEKTSFLNPSFPESIMPESKSMIVIIHDPCWHASIFQKNKMFESFSCNDFSTYFSLDNRFFSCDYISKSSFNKTRYNNGSISSFIEIESVV